MNREKKGPNLPYYSAPDRFKHSETTTSEAEETTVPQANLEIAAPGLSPKFMSGRGSHTETPPSNIEPSAQPPIGFSDMPTPVPPSPAPQDIDPGYPGGGPYNH